MAERIRNIRKTNYPELFLLAFTLKILRLHREKLLFSWILCILIAPKFSKEIQKTCLDVAGLYKYSKLHQGTCLGLHKPVIIIDCQLMCCPKLCVQLALYKKHLIIIIFQHIFLSHEACWKVFVKSEGLFFPLGVHCPFKKKLPVVFRLWMHLFYLIWRYNRGNKWIVTCYFLSC